MLAGQEFGPFIIEKTLGSGAMGAVYLARYTKNNHRVAIKIMSSAINSNASSSLVARFDRPATPGDGPHLAADPGPEPPRSP